MSLDRVDIKTTTGSTTEVTKSALPDGASTEAKQDSVIAEIKTLQAQENPKNPGSGDEYVVVGDTELRNTNKQILQSLKRIEMYLMKMTGVNL